VVGGCLYVLFIRFVYTVVGCGGWLGKVFRGFRCDGEVYAGFGRLALLAGVPLIRVVQFKPVLVEG
jgi:hypothetical protein